MLGVPGWRAVLELGVGNTGNPREWANVIWGSPTVARPVVENKSEEGTSGLLSEGSSERGKQ